MHKQTFKFMRIKILIHFYAIFIDKQKNKFEFELNLDLSFKSILKPM